MIQYDCAPKAAGGVHIWAVTGQTKKNQIKIKLNHNIFSQSKKFFIIYFFRACSINVIKTIARL